ncbi:hypothetical protein AAHE18_08G046400 [Arachis hypogaea]
MAEEKRPSSSFVKKSDRMIFTVDLRPGETTIVSWKKLLKDANRTNGSSSSEKPKLDDVIAPEQASDIEGKDANQPNRFSAVIEKIERLYMGKDSSDDEDMLDAPDDDQYDTEDSFIDDAELDEYFEVDNSAIKHDGFFVNRGKLERIAEAPALPNQQPKKRRRKETLKNPSEKDNDRVSNKQAKLSKPALEKKASVQAKSTLNSTQNLVAPEAKDADKQKKGVSQSKNISDKYKDAGGLLDPSHQKSHEKGAHVHSKAQPGRPSSTIGDLENTTRLKERNGMRELPDLNLSIGKSATQVTKSEHMIKKDGSSVRPKISVLEKAIRELEKMVAESRPPAVENQEADATSQAVKRRLPREIKLKLAKVARLAQSNQGKVSKELINRLNGILGHLIQLRTLKRNLKIMINTGLSAKQEKDDRFQQIKKEVVDMIKTLAPTLESKLRAGGDAQEFGSDGKMITKMKFSMDTALEDKICDLYDLYVEGLDENAGPQIRKLYAELAELWPSGCMDNHGIKRGICRAKERRRALHNRHKDPEKIKRKKLKPEENIRLETSHAQQNLREKSATESSSHAFPSANKPVSNTSTSGHVPSPSLNGLKQEKAKASSTSSLDDVRVADGALKKKKIKKKPEIDLEGAHFGTEKLGSGSSLGEDRPKSQRQSSGGVPSKSNPQPTSIPGLEQSS